MGEGEDYSTVSTVWDDLVDIIGDGVTTGVSHYIDNELNPQPAPAPAPVVVQSATAVNRTNTLIVVAVLGGLALLYFTRAK